MNPTARYDLRPGEWRPDPPHVAYGCDRNGIAVLLEAEQRASPWTSGESEAGPAIEVEGRVLGAPPSADDIEHLVARATPAPYGRGEETVLDPKVRQALQVEARHVRLGGPRWVRLREAMLGMVAEEMGLDDAKLDLVALKLLVYRPGGHFQAHADTEKTPGMVASAALVAPGAYRGGTLVIEHAGERLKVGAGGALRWRWAAWYADCRHRLEPVEDGVRIAMTFAVAVDAERALAPREARNHELRWALWDRSYAERHSAWAARGARIGAGNEQYGQKLVWVLEHRYTEPGLRACLLKGRDRDLARVLIDDRHGEACYLGWLQIREVGPARDAQGASVGDHGPGWYGAEDDDDDDPPPQTLVDRDHRYWEEEEWVRRIAHRETPALHLRDVARQNAWVEGLRSLEGEAADHGPIEVRDGEVVPPGALAHAAPDAARVYEATGNEGAALELQYRSAVLVLWRRNRATLRMHRPMRGATGARRGARPARRRATPARGAGGERRGGSRALARCARDRRGRAGTRRPPPDAGAGGRARRARGGRECAPRPLRRDGGGDRPRRRGRTVDRPMARRTHRGRHPRR